VTDRQITGLEEVRIRSYPIGMISILIADDHGIVREGLRRLLESEADLKVCAEASDGREALESSTSPCPAWEASRPSRS
jgi:PleD family two-component response regulator